MTNFSKYHSTICEICGSNLCEPKSVIVHFSDGNNETNSILSQVDASGLLADPTRQISAGMHAGSYCAACDGLLDELLEDIAEDEK